MTLSVLGALIAIIVSIIGILVQIIAVGIYIGKLEGFKTLVNYRFQILEKKQDKHNDVIERTSVVEFSLAERKAENDEIFRRLRKAKL